MEIALDAGAEDVVSDDEGGVEVISEPYDFAVVKDAFDKAGMKADVAGIVMKPLNEVLFSGDDAAKMHKLIDALESLDDVQEVYTSAVLVD